MSYRRKKLLALFCATALSMTAVAGCTGTKSSTGNVVSSETETNAEETSAQSEAGTFSSADMFTERDLAGTYEESGAVYVTLSDDGITGETDGVVIKDFDVMFNPEYKVDVLKIMVDACKRKPFSIIWPGKCEDGKLFYMEEMNEKEMFEKMIEEIEG